MPGGFTYALLDAANRAAVPPDAARIRMTEAHSRRVAPECRAYLRISRATLETATTTGYAR
ncbi:hypothetical protein FMUBM48_04850 [Nocardia cyriacigeorgica]|nr:hypothetical protein FMUBM48_04850 [Nocardia cyriacigeorgica]